MYYRNSVPDPSLTTSGDIMCLFLSSPRLHIDVQRWRPFIHFYGDKNVTLVTESMGSVSFIQYCGGVPDVVLYEMRPGVGLVHCFPPGIPLLGMHFLGTSWVKKRVI